jgi:hypothetical protein
VKTPFLARGTYVTMSSHGFVYRRRERAVRRVETGTIEPSGEIRTASVDELIASSPEWFVADAQARITKSNLAKVYVWSAIGLSLVGLLSSFSFGVVLAIALTTCGIFVARWDRERRTARITYDTSDPQIAERIAMASGAAEWLGACANLWHVFYAAATNDWKKNAGAGTLIRRTLTGCRRGVLPRFETNAATWCVPVGPQQLLFLPDCLLVWDGQRLAAIPYNHVHVHIESTRFIEDGGVVPRDSRQVGSTWRFVRRDGGPDLRFSGNAQLPIMEYGELDLRADGGLRIVLQTSNLASAQGAERALQALIARAQGMAQGAALTA